MNKCIGLFGTCGGSIWRDKFIAKYKELCISYFNPQKDNWQPEDAINEAQHLAKDSILLFPVTGETYGTGSLAEVGFAALNVFAAREYAVKRYIVVMVDRALDVGLVAVNPALGRESNRARNLVIEHLKQLSYENIVVVNDLNEMLTVSLKLWENL